MRKAHYIALLCDNGHEKEVFKLNAEGVPLKTKPKGIDELYELYWKEKKPKRATSNTSSGQPQNKKLAVGQTLCKVFDGVPFNGCITAILLPDDDWPAARTRRKAPGPSE